MLLGLGMVSGIGLGLASSPMAQLAQYMRNADTVSFWRSSD